MLNTMNHKVSNQINAPATGIIQRSSDSSFFLSFHQNSQLAGKLFDPKPEYENKPVSIIQVMLINKDYLLAEVIYVKTEIP